MHLPKILPIMTMALALSACQATGLQATSQQEPQATPVEIAEVGQAMIEDSSEFVASVGSRQFAAINPQVSGQVTQVFVQLGDPVAANTPLFQINPAQQQATVNSRTAGIEAARANLDSAKADLSSAQADRLTLLADLEYNQDLQTRNSSLFEEGAITRDTLDQSTRDLRMAEASLAAQEERIRSQEAAVARAERDLQQAQADAVEQEVQLQFYQVVAPFAGIVGDVPVKVGNYVTPQTTLTTLSQQQSLELSINIPLTRAPKIQIGTPIEILDDQNEVVGTSQISFIAPEADLSTQSVLVKAAYPNAQGSLRPDQLIRTRLVWQSDSSLVIPLTAVSRVAGQTFVFTVQPAPPPTPAPDGQTPTSDQPPGLIAAQKPVQLGSLQGNNYQVLSGLEPQQKIVVSGLQKIFDGAPIIDAAMLQQQAPPAGG
ncbi:MAG: efflux RND transporter periplasmic adaptor subunit [Cyanobacteriota bacterium]|nr:efflux RND transporter periplasmic adaptor subunit [Cyanobacteriota bacterium]